MSTKSILISEGFGLTEAACSARADGGWETLAIRLNDATRLLIGKAYVRHDAVD